MIKNGLKREREKRRWTQIETAKRAGLPQSTYSMLETGRAFPEQSELDALCAALGVSPEALYDPAILRAAFGLDVPDSPVRARRFFSAKIPADLAPAVDAALSKGYANRTEFVVDAVRRRLESLSLFDVEGL